MGTLAKGDSAKNLDRLFGCRARLVNRSNSSNARMTTASLPCFVTTWGARSRALRNTSLNCAFAACNCQVLEGDTSCFVPGPRFFEILVLIKITPTSQTRFIVLLLQV